MDRHPIPGNFGTSTRLRREGEAEAKVEAEVEAEIEIEAYVEARITIDNDRVPG